MCGISPELAERIFDPFLMTEKIGRGTGQGLAIVRAIVSERHRGSISVTSEPGSGTTFEIRLPITANQPEPTPA